MTFAFFQPGRGAVKAATVALLACALIAGCGGGSDPSSPTASSTVASGDGAAVAQVPIVAMPASGKAAESGTDTPVRNSRLDCAP
jgi:hypothetical protein